MVGVHLNAQDAGVIRHRRERHRLNVVALFEKIMPGLERGFFITYQDRYNRRLSTQQSQAQPGGAGRQSMEIGAQPSNELVVFRRSQDIANGGNGFQVRRRHGSAKDIGVGAHLEQKLKFLGAANKSPRAGKCLR